MQGDGSDDQVCRTDGGRDFEKLTDLNGIGPTRADKLRDAGYANIADVHEASQDELADVLGVDLARRVRDQLRDSEIPSDSEDTTSLDASGQESSDDGPTVPWSDTGDQESDDTGTAGATAAGDWNPGKDSGAANEDHDLSSEEEETKSTDSTDRSPETVSDDGESDVDEQWASDRDSEVADEGDSPSKTATGEPAVTPPSESGEESDTKPPKGADEKYCRSCGAVIKKQAELCPKCGVRQKGGKQPSTGGVRQKGGKQPSTGSSGPEDPASRLMAAGIGGVVALFGSLLPVIGQILGGVVAGYLRGPDTRESTICGALAGLIASIPSALFFGFFLFLGIIGSAAAGGGIEGVLFLGFLLVTVIVIYVALGAAGGFIGAMISDRSAPDT